jgi:hypothetical protein
MAFCSRTPSLIASVPLRQTVAQRSQRAHGGRLLRFLLGASPAAANLAALQEDGHLIQLLVVRPFLMQHAIHDAFLEALLRELLELGLIVRGLGRGALGLDARPDQLANDRGHRGDSLLGLAVQVDGGDERLERVGQDRGLVAPAGKLFPSPKAQVLAQFQFARQFRQARLAHQRRAQLG